MEKHSNRIVHEKQKAESTHRIGGQAGCSENNPQEC